MRAVSETPAFPRACTRTNAANLAACIDNIITHLALSFGDYGYRINRVLPKDGSEPMTGPMPLLSVTAAVLASDYPAADWEGAVIYVSDGAGGTRFRGSDGSNWVDLG